MPDGFAVNDPEHLDKALNPVSYGIFDTQDNCWLGDENGPRLYTREDSVALNGMPLETLSRIAAMIAEEQLGVERGRMEARVFDGGNFHLKDEMPIVMSALDALIKLEGGRDERTGKT